MPAVGQGQGKLRSRPATAGDLAIRSRYFRSKVSLLSGSHEWHITLASKMSCSIANFAKGSNDSICGTWERLADVLYNGGSSELKNKGWQAVGREKSSWSKNIAPLMDVDSNASPSFRYFQGKLRELT